MQEKYINLIVKAHEIKEKAYIYGGAIIGAAAPIVATRYLITGNEPVEPYAILGEILAWGSAVAVNCLPMLFKPHLPLPYYTGAAGFMVGTYASRVSETKRENKAEMKSIDHIINAN